MKKLLMISLTLISISGYASEFESELKLPEAHYNQKTGQTVVTVEPSQDSQNFYEQEQIINNIESRVGANKLLIIEKTPNTEE